MTAQGRFEPVALRGSSRSIRIAGYRLVERLVLGAKQPVESTSSKCPLLTVSAVQTLHANVADQPEPVIDTTDSVDFALAP